MVKNISELRCEMELDMLEILLSHAQHISAVGQEDIPALLVLSHILILALLEVVKLGRVVTLYPTSLIEMHRLPTALSRLATRLPTASSCISADCRVSRLSCSSISRTTTR